MRLPEINGKLLGYCLAGLAILSLHSCDDILEKDISEKSVDVLAPSDDTVIEEGEVSFWWNTLDGADEYEFQLVQPDFDAAVKLITDSVVSGNTLTLSLEAGSYQWRICALNSAYQSKYTTFNLTVVTEDDISTEVLSLLTPADNTQTSTTTITFSWEQISKADSYLFELVSPDFDNAETLVDSEELEDNSIELTLPAGSYQWRVKAMNDDSQTDYSTRSLTITP